MADRVGDPFSSSTSSAAVALLPTSSGTNSMVATLDPAKSMPSIPAVPAPEAPPNTLGGRVEATSAETPFVLMQYISITTTAGTVAHIPIPLAITGPDAATARAKDKELRDLLQKEHPHTNVSIKGIDYAQSRAILLENGTEKRVDLKGNVQYETLIREFTDVYERAATDLGFVCISPNIRPGANFRGDENGPICLHPATERLKKMSKGTWGQIKEWALLKDWFNGLPPV